MMTVLPSLWVVKVTPHFVACDYSVQHLQFRIRHADDTNFDCGPVIQLFLGAIFVTMWTHVAYGVFCGRFHVIPLTFQQQHQLLFGDLCE